MKKEKERKTEKQKERKRKKEKQKEKERFNSKIPYKNQKQPKKPTFTVSRGPQGP